MLAAMRDPRTWALAVGYGACFGIELTVNNLAAGYFTKTFAIGAVLAGALAGLHGGTNLFARASGGWVGDRAGRRFGLAARGKVLALLLAAEGLLLMVFSQMTSLGAALPVFVVFSICVAMSAGATYAVVPFVGRGGGAVAGIVGAGGNVGAVLCGFVIRTDGLATRTALLYLGEGVVVIAAIVGLVRFAAPARVSDATPALAPPLAAAD
jgi:NNP family nitrate/nitrite transporter-like MFS transporter